MNRRDFIKKLGLSVVAIQLSPLLDLAPIEEPVSIAATNIPVSLMGIPYHCSDATVGSWLGFSRSYEVKDQLLEMIDALYKDKDRGRK